MPQVFLIMRRTDIPEEEMQVVDLKPNTSQRSFPYTPPGQTGYIRNIPNDVADGLVGAGPTFTTSATLSGLSAYLLGNIDTGAGAGGAPFTGAQADLAAGLLVALAHGGSAIDGASVDAALATAVAGTSLSGGGSTGVLTELLSVMAGAVYQIDAGTDLAVAGVKVAAQQGAFVEGTYRALYDTGAFLISNAEGNISRLKAPTFTYLDTQGAAITVYSATGTVL
jgi:hypothetical protein